MVLRNYIHFSPFNNDLLAFAYDPTNASGVALYDLAANTFLEELHLSYFGPDGHGDGHDFAFTTPDNVIELNDGGAYNFNFNNNTTSNITGTGLGVSQIWGFDTYDKTGTHAIFGAQDDATHYTNDLNNGNNWLYTGHFGDGSKCRYLPGGQSIYGVQGDAFKINTITGNYGSNVGIQAVYGDVPFITAIKTSANNNFLYRGRNELHITKFDASFNQTSAAISHFEPIRSGPVQLNINGVLTWFSNSCYNGYVYDFEVDDEDKLIYVTQGANFGDNSTSCDKKALWGVLKTIGGGNDNPFIGGGCPSAAFPVYPFCWRPIATQNSLQLSGVPYAIAFNPSDTSQVWVAAGSYFDPSFPNNNRKVAFSNNGGITWQDFSTGLPDFPISDLVVRKGTNYEIYAATDIGVYYRTSQMSSWARVSTNLPYTQTIELKIDNCNNKLYAGTFGRGLWAIDLPPSPVPAALPKIEITNNTTHTGTKYYMQDIVVKSGNILTFNNAQVQMGAGAQIRVEPGARLNVYNSTIEGYCDKNMWRNILAQGVATQPQTLSNLDPYHGIVDINNSTIKDAKEAAVTCEYGGYVLAQNSNFINNRKGFEFHYYPYNSNYSKATNCLFETNASIKDAGNTPDSHVTMWAVNGVNFYGCTFRNTAPPSANGGYLGNGIYTADATFNILPLNGAVNAETAGRSTFSNLAYGIYAQTFGSSLKTINVINADFTSCYRGTYFKNIDFAKVQHSNYNNIPDDPYTLWPISPYGISSYGLYYDNCKNFFCENNNFRGNRVGNYSNQGLIINNANTSATRAYYCDFSRLRVGCNAQFDNFANNQGVGLKYNCNKYAGNIYDITIQGGITGNTNTDIDHVQGTYFGVNPTQNLVRNLYSAACNLGANNQWFDDRIGNPFQILHGNHNTQSGNGVGSFYTAPQTGCYDISKLSVIPYIAILNRNNDCPIIGAGSGCATCNRISLNAGISANKANLISEQAKLTAAGAASLISTSSSNQAPGQVKNALLQQSPYLSDALLSAYFNKSNTPPGHAKDVHAANAPVSQAVWQTIVAKNYPNGIFNQMQAAQNTTATSGRQNQEYLLLSIKSEIDYLYNHKIRLLLTDSLYFNTDSLETTLIASNYADKTAKLADYYINSKQYTKAIEQLNQLKQTAGTQQYVQLKQDILAAMQHSLGIGSIANDKVVKERTLQLANNRQLYGSENAQSLANFMWGNNYFEYTLLPPNASGSRMAQLKEETTEGAETKLSDGSLLKIIPNPSSDFTNINYKLPNNALSGKLIITDVSGKVIQYYEVIASLSFINFNTINLSNGVYFVTLFADNKICKTDKIVVIK